MKTLKDKVVVITGAGSGIGRALALNLAAKGSLLALSDVDDAGLAETVALVDAGRRRARSAATTSTSPTATRSPATPSTSSRTSAASTSSSTTPASRWPATSTDLEYADIDWIIGINFWGVVHGTKEFLPHLIASGDGHVVNLSSLFGLVSMPGQSMYNAVQVRRARHDRGAARGDAHRRAPGRRHLPCTPAASRPRSPATRASRPRRTRPRPPSSSTRSSPR